MALFHSQTRRHMINIFSSFNSFLASGLQRVCNQLSIFLFLNQNTSCGCSKEPSWDLWFYSKISFEKKSGIPWSVKHFGSKSGPKFFWAWSGSKMFGNVISRLHYSLQHEVSTILTWVGLFNPFGVGKFLLICIGYEMDYVIEGSITSSYLFCYLQGHRKFLFVCLIWIFTSHQQSFSYIGAGLPGLNQY